MADRHGLLWQGLLAHPDLLAQVLARMTPTTLQQLRLAALPGDRSGAAALELLRVKQLRYSPKLSDRQLQRVVELPCCQFWDDAPQRPAAALARAGHFTALQAAR
jgi:hypothetical protein